MHLVKQNQTNKINASPSADIFEYLMDDPSINGATAIIKGRYPEQGFAVNTVSKELALVLEGKGIVGLEKGETQIERGDVLLLQANEKFYWNGNITIFTVCSPAWKPEQHIIMKG